MLGSMKIDVISDTICPWCFIGKRRLERAIERAPDANVRVHWRPFQLDPSLPREGVDRKAYLARKFGDTPKARLMTAALRDAGEREGITFNFDRIARTPNSLNSHRLIRWSSTVGVQDDVVERLFLAYFTEGRDIGDEEVLGDIAHEAGMDRELVLELLQSDADVELVSREDSLARKMGIAGVPTFFFAGRYLLSGAEETHTLNAVITRLSNITSEASAASHAAAP
ncbi:MAG TPA: disulfide bond formation protein DsbA [Alphaproteobacteria bacterium]|nr:disulfide bond formation protein DsbA [Alphaproteobacteria bacterium]HAJ45087.1 disulfide bond formation protein DsbA [Alphaproteobacteria bacterium]